MDRKWGSRKIRHINERRKRQDSSLTLEKNILIEKDILLNEKEQSGKEKS